MLTTTGLVGPGEAGGRKRSVLHYDRALTTKRRMRLKLLGNDALSCIPVLGPPRQNIHHVVVDGNAIADHAVFTGRKPSGDRGERCTGGRRCDGRDRASGNPVRVGARWARAWSWCQPRPSMTRSTTADASSTSSSKSEDEPSSGSSRPGTIWVTQPSFQSGSTGEALIGEEASERQHAGTDVPA